MAARYLLLHAFPFDGSMWDDIAGRLRADGHEVIAPDLRGFGATPLGDSAPDVEVLVDDALAMLGNRAAVIAGCSMGGYVALGIVRRRPDLVAALALVDTKATADSEAVRAHRARLAALAEAGDDWSAGMLEGLLGETSRRTRPDLVARVEAALARVPGLTVAWAQRAMAARPDARPGLGLLAAPVVIAWGEEDILSPREEQELILAAAPHARIMGIPRCGHLSPLEAPDAVADVLRGVASGG